MEWMGVDTERVVGEVEKAFSSPGKLKILQLLMKNPDHTFTRYEIRNKIPLNSTDIKRNLTVLVEANWVKEIHLQHLQKYSINLDNELVTQFINLFKKIKYV